VLGVVGYQNVALLGNPSGDRLEVECWVPTYDDPGTGLAIDTTACVSGGIGTFWEIVK